MWGYVIEAIVVFVLTGLFVRKTWVGKLFGEIGDTAQRVAKDVGGAAKVVTADVKKL